MHDVLEYLTFDMTEKDFLTDFPYVEPEDIRAALAFTWERESRFVSIPPD